MRALLVAAMFILPVAGAVSLGPEIQIIQQPAQTTTGNATLSVEENQADSLVELAKLGDINGDGRDDLLLIENRFGDDAYTLAAHVTARSGANLDQVLWSYASADTEDAYAVGADDLDGDGIHDVWVLVASGGSSSYTSLGVLAASHYAFAFDDKATFNLLNGKTGKVQAKIDVRFDYEYQSTSAFAVAAFLSLSQSNMGYSNIRSLPPGLLGTVYGGYASHRASAFAGIVYESVSIYDEDAEVEGYTPDGTRLFRQEFNDPLRVVNGAALADFDGDGRMDAAVIDSLDLMAATASQTGLHAYQPVLQVLGQGGEVWRQELDMAAEVLGMWQVGDVDGDGAADLALYTLPMPGPSLELTLRSQIFSGKTGAILGDYASASAIRIVVPFGDVDGDEASEMLWLGVSDLFSSTADVGVSDAGMEPRWTVAWDAENDWLEGPFLAPDEGGLDFTGVAGPDLLMFRNIEGSIHWVWEGEFDGNDITYTQYMEIDPYRFTFEMIEGADGTVAWSLPIQDNFALFACGDGDGRGGEDLCSFRIVGNATDLNLGNLPKLSLYFDVYSGETGQVLFSQLLRSPQTIPLKYDGLLSVGAVDLGDLDGDGGAEWGVVLSEEPRVSDDSRKAPDMTWYVFSLSPATPVLSANNAPAPAGTKSLAPPAGNASLAAPETKALAAAASETESKGTPGVALIPVLAACLVAARRKRRA